MDGVETTYVRPIHKHVNNRCSSECQQQGEHSIHRYVSSTHCYHLVTCVFSSLYACVHLESTCATKCENAINGTVHSPTNEKMNGSVHLYIH